MQTPEPKIACPICAKTKSEFDELSRQINLARTLADKACHAKRLQVRAEEVLKEHGPADDLLSKACRATLELRKQTAGLILSIQRRA